MTNRAMRIGELPCLKGMEMTKELGDTRVEIILPESPDAKFSQGLGLQTRFISLRVFHLLFDGGENSIAAEKVYQQMLITYGIWKMCCPELADTHVRSHSVQRSNRWGMHKDVSDYSVLCADASCRPIGPTLLTSDSIALAAIENTPGITPENLSKNMKDSIAEHESLWLRMSDEQKADFLDKLRRKSGMIENDYSVHNAVAFSSGSTSHIAGPGARGQLRWLPSYKAK